MQIFLNTIASYYTKIFNDQQFFGYNSSSRDHNIILILITEDALRLLSLGDIILGDGTFKTIYGVIIVQVYPLVYHLGTKKLKKHVQQF